MTDKEKLVIRIKGGRVKIRCAPIKGGQTFRSKKDYSRKEKFQKDYE